MAKNRIHSKKTKASIEENNLFYNKNHAVDYKLRMIEANSPYFAYIYNSSRKLLVIFPSVSSLA